MTLLNNLVFDVKSTNNDLLNLSLAQYNEALDDRREDWIHSTHLPQGVKNDLKNVDHVKPELSDPGETRLSTLAQQEVKALKEHHQMLRHQIMILSIQGPSTYLYIHYSGNT